MKKSFFLRIMGVLLITIVTNVSYSQNPIWSPKAEMLKKENFSFVEEINAEKNSTTNRLRMNEINSRAARDFERHYKNTSGAEWFRLEEGFVVYFISNGINSRAYYTKKGYQEGEIRSYFEDKLSREIRHLVKTAYYDFNICHVYEYNIEDATLYLVKIMNKNSVKTVLVMNGKINVIEEYQKQNSAE